MASCGDGFVLAGVEQCDDGNSANSDACLNTCSAAACGDGFVLAGVKQCDDGNSDDADACLSTCSAAACGDGFVRAGVEQCDDDSHGCALLDDNTVKCWGYNGYGQLGLGDTTSRGSTNGTIGDNLPALSLGTGLIPAQVATATNSSCAIFTNGKVKCWGYNNAGQLGLGDTSARGDASNEIGDNLPFVSIP